MRWCEIAVVELMLGCCNAEQFKVRPCKLLICSRFGIKKTFTETYAAKKFSQLQKVFRTWSFGGSVINYPKLFV